MWTCGTQTKDTPEFRNKGKHPFIRFVELARTEKTLRNPVRCHPNRKEPGPRSMPPPTPSTRWPTSITWFTTNPSPKSLLPHSSTSSDLVQCSPVASILSTRTKTLVSRTASFLLSLNLPIATVSAMHSEPTVLVVVEVHSIGQRVLAQVPTLRNYNSQRVRLPFIYPDLFA